MLVEWLVVLWGREWGRRRGRRRAVVMDDWRVDWRAWWLVDQRERLVDQRADQWGWLTAESWDHCWEHWRAGVWEEDWEGCSADQRAHQTAHQPSFFSNNSHLAPPIMTSHFLKKKKSKETECFWSEMRWLVDREKK
jgi:hypothetical protein